uniref:RanBP2-type domain-containing protein n=1 Tax=Trichuris muris TaxID=70415 RepID=A0A5S6Q922_TRIMR
MEGKFVVRVQSPEGIERFSVDLGTTVGQLKARLRKSWPTLPEDFCLSASREAADGFVDTRCSLVSYGIRHGDLIYLVTDSTDMNVEEEPSKTAFNVAADSNVVVDRRDMPEDPVDLYLYQQPGVVQREVDSSLCDHGEETQCGNCKSIEVFDADYLKEHSIKFLSFHAYLRKLGCGSKNGPRYPLEKLNCQMKKDCTRHPPWPKGVCLRCQPPAITLQRQPYRHVDNICFENEEIGNRFFIFWQKTGFQRFGYLIGRYEPYSDVPLGIMAVVCAIFEPPQISSPTRLSIARIADQPHLMELCNALGCSVVGVIFTDLFEQETNGSKMMMCKRNGDTYFLTAAECIRAASFQNSFPNICRYSSDKTFGSKFVTVVASGGEDGGVKVVGYQVSNQCAAIVEASLLLPVVGKPHLMHVKESTNEQCTPSISYRALNEYGNAVMRAAAPLPVEFLIVDMPVGMAKSAKRSFNPLAVVKSFPVENREVAGEVQNLPVLRAYCDQFTVGQELELASDFHFLYFLLTNNFHPIDLKELSPLLEAVRSKDRTLATEWFDSNNEWAELKAMLMQAGNDKPLDIHAAGTGNQGTSDEWRCLHCTFVNRGQGTDCVMCSLPRMF